MDPLTIIPARADAPEVIALLERHHALMRETSPPESCHVMDASELVAADVSLLAARREGVVLGVGALKTIEDRHGELKSMHTAAEARGQGIAQSILAELMATAVKIGLTRISLETGSQALFAPARALYAANGFTECAPFGDYVVDPLSVFMTRSLLPE